MKYFVVLLFFFALLSTPANAQDYRKHTVEKGETVVSIAKKYKITPYDIYRLNPDAQNGIKVDSTLLIPKESKSPAAPVTEQPTKIANTIHKAEAKETLYSIAKQYNVTVDEIKKANGTSLDKGLQIGQEIIIPIKGGSGVAQQAQAVTKGEDKSIPQKYFYHTVEAGETKYSIAKQYGMTLQLLEELNPEVKETLPLGYKLKLDKNAVVEKETRPESPGTTQMEFTIYEVQPKETFYSIGKKTGLSEEQIISYNPEAKSGLKDGMRLRLPKTVVLAQPGVPSSAPDETKIPLETRPLTGLAATLKKNKPKELALLLPFNMSRIESDTVRSQLLRTDKFLNMTLDFYAGALMAIDSAKVLGLPLKVRIMDSKETRTSSDVASLIGSMSSTNAVIGPFFPANAENMASLLAEKNISVISPLSREETRPFANLYQSVPTEATVRLAMLDYLRAKAGNVIAVIDAKKGSSKEFIKQHYPSAAFAGLNADGSIIVDGLKRMLVKDKMNYVILETERMGMVLSTTKALADVLPEYQIQLVVLERYDIFDNDELPLNRLTSLKMLYPSVTRSNESPEAAIFARQFKEKNGIFPSQYATRGFDVTFDTILRLFQEEGFEKAASDKASEQVENKFVYMEQNEGNYNTGVYILQYNDDLSVKPAE